MLKKNQSQLNSKQKIMGNKNSKINAILLIVILILLIATIFLVTKKADAPVIDNNADIGILGNGNDLVFLSILPGAKVSGILNLTGEVKGGYFFEANILVNVLDKNKNVLRQGHGTATMNWMTSGPVSFTAQIDFIGLTSQPGYLEIHNDNASGLPENDKSILIPIIIE